MHESPATSTSVGKYVLSIGLIVMSFLYVLRTNGNAPLVAFVHRTLHIGGITSDGTSPGQAYKKANENLLQIAVQATTSVTPVTTTTNQIPQTTAVPQTKKTTGTYTDGSYTGTAADAYYGTVQVKAIVQNGQLADVQFLQYPNDRSNSRFINNQAMPLLTQEAIQAQSAQVNGVSGATFTSQAFTESLAAALTNAKIK